VWGGVHDGDVIEFTPPVMAVTPKDVSPNGRVLVDFLKRVVGVPGDLVEIRKGMLYRNGAAVSEPYVAEKSEVDFRLVR